MLFTKGQTVYAKGNITHKGKEETLNTQALIMLDTDKGQSTTCVKLQNFKGHEGVLMKVPVEILSANRGS